MSVALQHVPWLAASVRASIESFLKIPGERLRGFLPPGFAPSSPSPHTALLSFRYRELTLGRQLACDLTVGVPLRSPREELGAAPLFVLGYATSDPVLGDTAAREGRWPVRSVPSLRFRSTPGELDCRVGDADGWFLEMEDAHPGPSFDVRSYLRPLYSKDRGGVWRSESRTEGLMSAHRRQAPTVFVRRHALFGELDVSGLACVPHAQIIAPRRGVGWTVTESARPARPPSQWSRCQ